MNYSEMSDFEINKQVAKALGLDFSGVTEESRHMYNIMDYCNSWTDAGPIITANKISVMYDENTWAAFSGMSIHHSRYADWDLLEYDKNPLRAAMIVFLMMREQK